MFDRDTHYENTIKFCEDNTENEKGKLIERSHKYRLFESSFNSSHCKQQKEPEKKLINQLPFLTFSEYMQFVMYDRQHGYYSGGKVKFREHFGTNATRNKALAFINLLDMYQQWQDSGMPEKFYNYEGGAGSGKLALDTLSFAEELAKLSSEKLNWSKFYNALQYIIVEISPALAKAQAKLCKKHIDQKKLVIINADVIEFQPITKIHRFCSNELLDDFPLEGFKKDQEGDILALTKLQVIPRQILSKYIQENNISAIDADGTYYQEVLGSIDDLKNALEFSSKYIQDRIISKIEADDRYYRKELRNMGTIEIPAEVYVVNKDILSKMPNDLKSVSQYLDVYLPYQYFQFSTAVLKDNLYILSDLKFDETTYVNVYLNKFAKTIQSADRILFFDYGGIGKEVSPDVRYFGNEVQSREIFDLFTQRPRIMPQPPQKKLTNNDIFINITHHVDFCAVARAFKDGFKIQFYGHQSNILGALDKESFKQAISILYKDIEDNYCTIDEECRKVVDPELLLFYHLQDFIYKASGFKKFIVLERQAKLSEEYYPLPDLINNFSLWHRYEEYLFEEKRLKDLSMQKYNTESALIPYNCKSLGYK